MTAVIYARYSSDNQREESIEGQIRECTAYAEKNGITVIKHYIDRAFSAKTDNRPEFQQMIKDSGKKLFDVVLVWKFDRFARNRFDSANYKMILKKNGVHLISVMEPIAEGSQGILVETLLEGMAEYYSAELSEKVIRGQTENALKGKCTGGTGTIGYKIDEDKFYHLDPLTAPLVLEAFQRYDNGDKMVEIVNFLNDKGVRNMLGGKMTHSSVNTMLKNRRYIGELSFRDIVVPDAIPVIVPKDLFDRVQKRLDKNKRAPACGKADEEYLLTTKLFCGKCGALMFGESGTSATGRTYYYYKSSATVKFLYGLAGSGSRQKVTIAYDIKWSERPIYVGIDSFGIGWIAADSSSHQLATKTASAVGEVSYCYASTGNSAGLSSSVDMDTSQSGGVVGTPVIINHQNTSTYGKHISGTVGVGTQSNSSNMETIQIFVAYAHSTVSVTFSADVALQWKQVGMSINFTPQKKTTIIARGNATFKYNGQGYQTAGTV